MKRWNNTAGAYAENLKIDAFLAEVADVCKKHGMSISHEDHHGSFEVAYYSEAAAKWLASASDDTK